MGQNKVVQLGALGVLALAVVIALTTCRSEDPPPRDAIDVGSGEPLSQAALAGLGLEGDTEKDVVATLIGEVRDMKAGIEQLRRDNTALRADNAELKRMEQTIGRRVETQLLDAEQTVANNLDAEYRSMVRRLEEAERLLTKTQSMRTAPAVPAADGLPAVETVWVQPLGREG
ncbi:MAG: hypothetical protein KDI01_02665, partial [Halioglobus sp.]|nr:hypothetical protein [Halioglobus sp.]